MATIATLHVLLTAKDQMSGTMNKAEGRLQSIGKTAKRLAIPMAAAGAAIVGLGAVAVRTFAGFEQQMARAGALSGATGDQLEQMTEVAKRMGRETQFSANQAASALSFLSQAGFKVEESTAALPGVLQLAAAAQLDLGRAADITSNVLTGYGFQVSDLSRVNDVLAKTFTSANTDLTQLGQALKFAGPVASAAGVRFEEASAAIALMGNAGIQATMAGTSLRGAISRMLNPSKEAAALLKEMGVQTTNSAGKLLPLVDIIGQLEDANLSAGDALTIFGQRAGPALLALVNQGSDALAAFTKELDNSGGTAERIAKQQMATLQGTLTRLKSAAEGLAIALGTVLAPVVEVVATGMIKITNLVTGFLEKMGKAPAIIEGATKALDGFKESASLLDEALASVALSAKEANLAMLQLQRLDLTKQIAELQAFTTALLARPQRDRFGGALQGALEQTKALIEQKKRLTEEIRAGTEAIHNETSALQAQSRTPPVSIEDVAAGIKARMEARNQARQADLLADIAGKAQLRKLQQDFIKEQDAIAKAAIQAEITLLTDHLNGVLNQRRQHIDEDLAAISRATTEKLRLIDVERRAKENAIEAMINADRRQRESIDSTVSKWQFAATEAGLLKLSIDTIGEAFVATGGSAMEAQRALIAVGGAAGDVNAFISALGLTVTEAKTLVDSLTGSLRNLASAARLSQKEEEANRLAERVATSIQNIGNQRRSDDRTLNLTVNQTAPSFESRDTVAQIWRDVANDGGFQEFINN